jgi:hypothetical protein
MNPAQALTALATREAQLRVRVHAAVGWLEDKTAQLGEQGVFAAYEQIHREYVDLITPDANGLEALKRALFIQWYAWVEPAFLSGVSDVDLQATARVFDELVRLAALTEFDAELRSMASWYFIVGDHCFPASVRPALAPLLNLEQPLQAAKVAGVHWPSDRGQMGEYWNQILSSKTASRGA